VLRLAEERKRGAGSGQPAGCTAGRASDGRHGVAARAGRKQGRGARGPARGEGKTAGPMRNSDILELFKYFYLN
jgi:hypothetical protein